MLCGERVTLRPVRESDLNEVYAAHLDLRSRGAYFPLGVRRTPGSLGSSGPKSIP